MSTSSSLDLIALTRTTDLRDRVNEAVRGCEDIRLDARVGALKSLSDELSQSDRSPDILLLDLDAENPDDLTLLDKLRQQFGERGATVLVTAINVTPPLMRRLMRAGAADVVPQPFEVDDLADALRSIQSARTRIHEERHSGNGRVIAFSRASGGAGATTLAVNAAIALRQPRPNGMAWFRRKTAAGNVCLIDLDLQFGAVGLQLDLPGNGSFVELVKNPERLDRDMFTDMLTTHESTGLRVLTAPKMPIPLEAVSPELIQKMLDLARGEFDHVLIDLPQTLTRWTETVLSAANDIVLVTQLNVPALRQLRRLLDTLHEEGLYALPYRLVVNRHENSWSKGAHSVSRRQAEKALGRKIDFVVGNEDRLALNSVNLGKPAIMLKRRCRIARDVIAMLETLARKHAAASGAAAPAAA